MIEKNENTFRPAVDASNLVRARLQEVNLHRFEDLKGGKADNTTVEHTIYSVELFVKKIMMLAAHSLATLDFIVVIFD